MSFIDYIVSIFQGDQIHAICKSDHLKSWKADLKENCTYVMHNFKVVKNDDQFRVCEHEYKLFFIGVTVVREADLHELPFKEFRFVEFANVVAGNFDMWQFCWFFGNFIIIDTQFGFVACGLLFFVALVLTFYLQFWCHSVVTFQLQFFNTYILHSFASATCFVDYHFGVTLWFWVGDFQFYSLGSFLPLWLLLQFKV